MNDVERALQERLRHIVEWGARVERYVADMDVDGFIADLKTQDAVIRCLEVVGEASGHILRLQPEFEANHPGLDLAAAYRARNRTVHGYGSVDLLVVWRTATVHCPELLRRISKILAGIAPSDHGS